jgi:hypothetical protein
VDFSTIDADFFAVKKPVNTHFIVICVEAIDAFTAVADGVDSCELSRDLSSASGHHLEHIPSELTRGDSQRSAEERVCRP